MKDKKYIIFDLDGTLVDSFTTVVNACKRVVEEYAHTTIPSYEFFENYRNSDMEQMFIDLAKKTKMSQRVFRNYYDKKYSENFIVGTTPILKQHEILKMAKTNGIGIIVLTNKLQRLAEYVCNKLFPDEIDIIIGREGTEPIKPRHVMHDRLQAHNIEAKKQCIIYYGDSIVDEKSAEILSVPFERI